MVTKLLVIRKTLMISAAVVSSFLAPWMRPVGRSSVSPGSPSMCGITATPVSKPDRPSASLGKTSRASPTMTTGLPCWTVSAWDQSATSDGAVRTCHSPTPTTTTFSVR